MEEDVLVPHKTFHCETIEVQLKDMSNIGTYLSLERFEMVVREVLR
jgi:hypothetical protein